MAEANSTSSFTQMLAFDERTQFYVPTMMVILVATALAGTAILEIAKRCRSTSTPETQEQEQQPHQQQSVTYGQPSSDDQVTLHLMDSNLQQQSQIRYRHNKQVAQRCLVGVVVMSTYLICLAATFVTMEAGHLSKERGLSWEAYTFLLSAGCAWQLVQAVAAAIWLPKGREHSLTAFAAAMLSGIFPLVSDSYDMLKDALFGGLCLQTNDPFTQTLGIFSWVYLLACHIVLLLIPGPRRSLAATHLAVWNAPTDVTGRKDKSSSWCQKAMRNDLLPGIYKQMTPTKRFMLAVENIPQAVMAVIYVLREGGSIIVTVLNICIPVVQMSGYLFMRRAVAPWYALQFDAALRTSDESMLEPLLVAADLQHDKRLLKEVATHCCLFKDEPTLKFKTRLSRAGGSEILEHRVDFISKCLFALGPGDHTLRLSRRPHQEDELMALELKALKFWLQRTDFINYDLLLDDNCIRDTHGKVLAEILRVGTVRSMDVRGHKMKVPACLELVWAAKDCCVRELHLFKVAHSSTFLAQAFAGKCTREALDLQSCEVSDEAAQVLAEALDVNDVRIEELNLDGNLICDDGAQALAKALERNVLRVLHLAGNQIGATGIQALLSAAKQSSVQELYLAKLEDSQKNTVFARVLAGKFESEVLDLANCGVSDHSAEALAYSLRYNAVKVLHLEGNRIGVAGAQALATEAESLSVQLYLRVGQSPCTKAAG